MKKPTILEIDNVRIRKWDEMNYVVEQEETKKIFNPQTKQKEERTAYAFKGYYPSVFKALQATHTKGLLIDESNQQGIFSLLQQIDLSKRQIIKAIERVSADE